MRFSNRVYRKPLLFMVTLMVGLAENSGRLARAMLGRSTNFGAIFHHALSGTPLLMPGGMWIAVQTLAMAGMALWHLRLHREATDRGDKDQ